ncbi:MAG: helix-turn-helix transcriptional regulator [Clostridia bacterium]|nr:helix-turn-helix transcriptional regulator [Clostridia bacterium]
MKYNIKIEVIENFMMENKISKTKFCKLCKISIRTLNKIMTNNDNFRIIALFKIAKVIKVQVNQMFD